MISSPFLPADIASTSATSRHSSNGLGSCRKLAAKRSSARCSTVKTVMQRRRRADLQGGEAHRVRPHLTGTVAAARALNCLIALLFAAGSAPALERPPNQRYEERVCWGVAKWYGSGF